MKRILSALLVLLLASTISSAQKEWHFYYGKVLEEGTRRPLQNVNLSVTGTRTGTVTDRKGAFSFYTDTIPATLVVSCVGFASKTVLLDATSFSLTLYLPHQAQELAEVEIRADFNEPYFRDEHYTVRDYEIDSGLVYLLVYPERVSKAELICKGILGDTVARSQPFSFTPVRLFRDCLGFMHVLGHDSAYQVYRKEKTLCLIHPVKMKKFDEVLKGCVAATPEVLYFQRETNHGLSVEYFGVNRKTLSKQSIAQVAEEKKLKMLRRNTDDAMWLNSKQPDGNDDFVTWNYVHKILYRPVKTALYSVGSYIAIFNTPDRQVEFYDSAGGFSYKLALSIDKVSDGRWSADILVDGSTGKVYTTFLRNGTCSVYSVNLNTGELKHRVSIGQPYPEKVRVYNDWVYYLYNVPGDTDNKVLYRQKM